MIAGSNWKMWIMEFVIGLRFKVYRRLTRPLLQISFRASDDTKVISDTQSHCFYLNYLLCAIFNIILAWKANVLITPQAML